MADIAIDRSHGHGREEALRRVREMLDTFRKEKPSAISKIDWEAGGFAARIEGTGFKGHARVDEARVTVELSLSFLARPLKGRIEDGLRRRLDEALG